MNTKQSKVGRSFLVPVITFSVLGFLYYREPDSPIFTWHLLAMIALMWIASLVTVWWLPLERRALMLVLNGLWVLALYTQGNLLSPWFLVILGAGVLTIVCAVAFWPVRLGKNLDGKNAH